MEGTLQIHLLGEFNLVCGDQIITDVDTPRLQSLLAYLLLHREAPQSRQRLSFLFWPDSSESQARTNLRNLLHLLREALPDAERYLSADNKTIMWQPEAPFELDVAQFEAQIEQAEQAEKRGDREERHQALKEAVRLYKGELLPNCYDDWIIPIREGLSQVFVENCKRLIDGLEGQRAYSEAIQHTRRLLHVDPLDEWAYRRLMRLQAENGELAQALHTYQRCAQVLERELGVEPGAATRELYEQLLEVDSQPLRVPRGEAEGWPLVGREEAWQRLVSAWRIAAESRPHLAVLSGEAGIGKTRLGEEMLSWAAGQGIPVGHTRSYPGEGNLAYTPLLNLMREEPFRSQTSSLEAVWLREAARLLPEILSEKPDLPPPEPLTEEWQRQRLFEACARAILGKKGTLLLLIDDLQWCDRETMEWLHYLLHFEPQPRLLVLGTVRSEEVAPESHLASLCADLHRSGQLTQIELSRLTQAETLELVENVAGKELDPDLASQIHRDSEGNPLFVVEMTQAQLSPVTERGGYISLTAPVGAQSGTRLPPKIQSVIATRLSQLSGNARQLASAAAVIGREFTFETLNLAVAEDEEAVALGLDELWRLRIIRERGPLVYDFGHDKFREVIYRGLSPPRRALLHRKAAQALEKLHPAKVDEMSSRLGHHYLEGGEIEAAMEYLLRAGDQARRLYAHPEAIAHYQKTLDLLGSEPDEMHLSILWRALLGIGKALQREARYPEAEEVFKRMVAEAESAGDEKAQAQGWLGMSIVQDRLGNHAGARKSAERAEKAARSADARDEMGIAFLLQGWAACMVGDQKEALRLGEAALEISRASGDRREMARSLNLLGQANDALGNYDQAQHHKEKALELFRELGDRRWVGSMLNNLANTANLRGEYERAIPLYEEALTISSEVSDRDWNRAFLVNLGAARVGVGDYRSAQSDLRQVLELSAGSDWMGLSLTHYWLAEALLGLGEIEEALAEAQRAMQHARESGRTEDLGVAWRALGKCGGKTSSPVQMDGESHTPPQCFNKSLEILQEINAQPEIGWTLRDWAEYELQSGDRTRGEEMWSQAREIFSHLGMADVVKRMDQAPFTQGSQSGEPQG